MRKYFSTKFFANRIFYIHLSTYSAGKTFFCITDEVHQLHQLVKKELFRTICTEIPVKVLAQQMLFGSP